MQRSLFLMILWREEAQQWLGDSQLATEGFFEVLTFSSVHKIPLTQLTGSLES